MFLIRCFLRASEREPRNGGNDSRLWRLALGSGGRGFLRDGSRVRATHFKSLFQNRGRSASVVAVRSHRARRRLAALKDIREERKGLYVPFELVPVLKDARRNDTYKNPKTPRGESTSSYLWVLGSWREPSSTLCEV